MFRSLLLLGKWEDPKRRRKRENCLRAQSSKNGLSMREVGEPEENVGGIAVNYQKAAAAAAAARLQKEERS